MKTISPLALAALFLVCSAFHAQTPSASPYDAVTPCSVLAPSVPQPTGNLFTVPQEQIFGDALADLTEYDLHLAPLSDSAHITEIGNRLLAQIPPTGLHFTFRIYESGDINAFSLAGGRVYVSRKLITAVTSEDELAGVIAHEIGHIAAHQLAAEYSRVFRVRLGITSVTDRDSIYTAVHRLYSTPPKRNELDDVDDIKDELVADRLALYMMVKSGYAPSTFSWFFNQVSQNNGKTGNFFTNALNLSGEDTQRYRAQVKITAELPDTCRDRKPIPNPDFLSWQAGIIEHKTQTASNTVDGDSPLKLDPIRPSLLRIRYSPNGSFVLAQSEGSIAVFERSSQKVLLKVDAPDINAAQFSPDSTAIVFWNDDLRIERWDIASAKRTSVHELVDFKGCDETALSPDGKFLACASAIVHQQLPRITIRLIDVESGKAILDLPNFWDPVSMMSTNAYWQFVSAVDNYLSGHVCDIVFTPDGQYFLAVAGQRSILYNLSTRQTAPLTGALKGLPENRIAFLSPQKLYITGDYQQATKLYSARIISFPDGKLLTESKIGKQTVEATTSGDNLIIRPIGKYQSAIFDPVTGTALAVSLYSPMDAFGTDFAASDAFGNLLLGRIHQTGTTVIPVPIGSLPGIHALDLSREGRYLALSLRERAVVWDLQTGKQLMLTKPFRDAWFDPQDHLYVQMNKFHEDDPTEFMLNMNGTPGHSFGKYENTDWQFRDLQYVYTPLSASSKNTHFHASFAVKDPETKKVLWSRDYAHETPACWGGNEDRILLAWDLQSETAKEEVKAHPELQHESAAMNNKNHGLLVEFVNPKTGDPLSRVVVPEADLTNGRHDVRRAFASGNFLLVHGEHSNTVVYKIDTGEKLSEFFGSTLDADSNSGVAAAIHADDEVLLVQMTTGKQLARYSFGSDVLFARIIHPGSAAPQLYVFTADQVLHRIPISH